MGKHTLFIRHYLKNLYSWIMPFTCILCQHPADNTYDLCEACHQELPILPYYCPRCARQIFIDAIICGECIKNPPPFDATYTLFSYENTVRQLILKLKFSHALVNARVLGELLTKKIQSIWYVNKSLPDVIIPIPLHRERIKERGFNQALEIARPIAKRLNLPIDIVSAQRIRHTVTQARLPAEKRRGNMKNAFQVRGDFSNRHIAVIDDVITTGYTMTELAKVLKKAGAGKIDVWCCARTAKNAGGE